MLTLHTYWRSSAAYRVRIALEHKHLAWSAIPINLQAGAQRDPAYLARNPQGFVPMLEDGSTRITQSLAIIEYLEERHPAPPLLPESPALRAQVRSMAALIACDIHPLNNLRVTRYLRDELGQPPERVERWIRHWISEGLSALEAQLVPASAFLCGDRVSIADVCLLPQLYNAERFGCDLSGCPQVRTIGARLAALPAFAAAHPDRQPDAPAR